MKQPRLSDLAIDREGTKRIRASIAKTKKVKITINIYEDSLELLKKIAGETGTPYQKLLNLVLKEGLKRRNDSESRLDRLEREIEKLKKKVAVKRAHGSLPSL
jgi:predicted DNA binding CopG/RHH family protein